MEEKLKVAEAANGSVYENLFSLHRIWNFVSPDRVEILSGGSSLFIDPLSIRFIYEKTTRTGDWFAVDMSVLEGSKYFSYRVVYSTEAMADTAILQLKDLLRNYDVYRYLQYPPEQPVVTQEESIPEQPVSLWGRLKYIFSQ